MPLSETAALNRSREIPATTQSGYAMLLVALFATGCGASLFIAPASADEASMVWFLIAVLSLFGGLLTFTGFYTINPNEAPPIQLFGAYKGTDRTKGLRWVPAMAQPS